MSGLKLLQMALITFGIVFCLVYPLAMVWPSVSRSRRSFA